MIDKTRRAGVLLHPTSLPGPNGIGELGAQAHHFLDWIARAGQRVWQVMPLGPTGYGDSPYQCFSAFAGNPLLISMDKLVESGLLQVEELAPLRELPSDHVDYGRLIPRKRSILEQAFRRFQLQAGSDGQDHFRKFCEHHSSWLEDYALFMTIKRFQGGQSWNGWPTGLRERDPETLAGFSREQSDSILLEKWLQYISFEQWREVREEARSKGILILGDLPIFVAYDSADTWSHPHLFHLDNSGNPTVVAGVPPDYFSRTGQRWGNPLYRWEAHIAEGFAWWEARIGTMREMMDLIRIDHFRGFSACWEIPASEPTAEHGRWVNAPGEMLFDALRSRMGELPLVAEDLGVITPEVVQLRKKFGFPGMRVLQFAWGSGASNPFLPHHHEPDSVVYTGTHDNNTTVGWYNAETSEEMRRHLMEYIGHPVGEINWELLRIAYASPAVIAVAPIQDLLGLDASARMNTPGSAAGNWGWRLQSGQLDDNLARRLEAMASLYGRDGHGESER